MTDIKALIRENIRSLVPYSSARDEYSGEGAVLLDANENPYNGPINRYPDPHQVELKKRISAIKKVPVSNLFLGNGSDEAIDLLIRAFCEPSRDNILAIKPTYGMYKVCADINGVEYRDVLLDDQFRVNADRLISLSDGHSKLLFLCSPNNPTSNSFEPEAIKELIGRFEGLVILDEAYIDFSTRPSFTLELERHPNLVILQTLSKAWGMAGIRLGMAFAVKEIIDILNRIKYPYNISLLTQQTALKSLSYVAAKEKWVKNILEQRKLLQQKLSRFAIVKDILPSDANFLMVRFDDPKSVFDFLIGRKIIVRDRSRVALCNGYLRITVGSAEDNMLLINALNDFSSVQSSRIPKMQHP
jgi:histidinol-phosphate aminotransferase